jgi:hypothetical protein
VPNPPLKPLLKKAKHGFKGYPVATVMFYGPDDRTATKVSVGIVPGERQEPAELRRWICDADVRNDARIADELRAFVAASGARTVVMTGKINGCPHEAGVDYEGDVCPRCPFWAGRDRWTGSSAPR